MPGLSLLHTAASELKPRETRLERAYFERIAARASTLSERIAGEYRPLKRQERPELAAQRLHQFRLKAALGDERQFARRLTWLSLAEDDLIPLLGDVERVGPLPAWVEVLSAALGAKPAAETARLACLHPFGELVTGFAEVGMARVKAHQAASLCDEVWPDLLADLLGRLSQLAAPAFYECFEVQRRAARDLAASDGLFRSFIDDLRRGGLTSFFAEYSSLARLLASAVEMWSSFITELVAHYDRDAARLSAAFELAPPLGRIARLRCSLSDPHDGGKTVAYLESEHGLRVYYKPRNLAIEVAWYELVGALNARGHDMKTCRVLDCDDHGWVEPVRHAECRDASEARAFYERAGKLLCLQYALGATDCIYDNIVASGDQPVLIDQEACLHPVLERPTTHSSAELAADGIVARSVLRTGFLPAWLLGPSGRCVDISGLGAEPGQSTPYKKRRWRGVNTDSMTREWRYTSISRSEHRAVLRGTLIRAADHVAQVTSGFCAMYATLLDARDELMAPGGALADFSSSTVRLLFHPTRFYSLLLERLEAPSFLREGVDRSLELELVSRLYLGTGHEADFVPVLAAELAALERADIPRFQIGAGEQALELPNGGKLENAFPVTAFEQAQRRLRSLSPADQALQTAFIEAALRLSVDASDHVGSSEAAQCAGSTTPSSGEAGLSFDELTRAALEIAGSLEDGAIRIEGQGVTWIAPQLILQTGYRELRPLRMDLYGGLGGVALFYSALHRVCGSGKEVALSLLAPLASYLTRVSAQGLVEAGYSLGATGGVGGFLYLLARCSALLDEPRFLDAAERVVDSFSPEWIAKDRSFDVMTGAAGAAIGLVCHAAATRSQRALDLAVLCGEHLLRYQRPAPFGGAAWPSPRGACLTGMSHGAAGIALALARLSAATSDTRFARAALSGMAFESAVFDREAQNWPDYRNGANGGVGYRAAWCHGAAGIGLSRLACRAVLPAADLDPDIERAVTAVVREGLHDHDHLCCGNAGRIALLNAAEGVGVAASREHSAALMKRVVLRARERGYRLGEHRPEKLLDPSLFQGVSGIGLQLLRCAAPEQVPCVGMWE